MKLLSFAFLAIVATAESLRCEPDSVFKIDCNTCRCSQDGEHALCTLKACIDFSDSSNTHITSKYEVTEEVPVLSTEHYESEEYDDAMQVPDFLCTEVKSFNHYCNLCSCSAVGHPPFCTLMGCSSKYWNKDGTRKSNVDEEVTIQPLSEEYTTVVSESEENKTEK